MSADPPSGRLSRTARLFFALWPDRATREALTALQRAASPGAQARLTAPRDLHVTLLFIGAWPRQRLPALEAAAVEAAAPFELVFTHAACWPAGLWVLEPDGVPEGLVDLHERLAHAARAAGATVEVRRYRPHVTLARRSKPMPPMQLDKPLTWQVDGYVLAESDGGYRVLRRWGRSGEGGD